MFLYCHLYHKTLQPFLSKTERYMLKKIAVLNTVSNSLTLKKFSYKLQCKIRLHNFDSEFLKYLVVMHNVLPK